MHDPESKDVREAIVQESTKLFLTNGFRGTSIKKIAESVGIGKSVPYYYFKGKDEILLAILRRFENEYLDEIIEALGNCEGNFIDKYRLFIKRAAEYARDNRSMALAFTTLRGKVIGDNSEAEKVVRAIYEKYLKFLEGMLDDGKSEGTVNAQLDTAIYAHIIIAFNTGMMLEWLVFDDKLDMKAFVKKMRDVLLHGITIQGSIPGLR